MLVDELKHIKNLKSLLEQNQLELSSAKPELIRSVPQTGARGKVFTEEMWKQSKGNLCLHYLGKPSWWFVIGCL